MNDLKAVSDGNKELAAKVETPLGDVIVSFHSNDEKTCLRCGVLITKENDSGWEAFTGRAPGETQPECKDCDEAIRKKPVVFVDDEE